MARIYRANRVNDELFFCTITCPYDVGQHLLIDLHALRMLSSGQLPFSPGVHIERSLPIVYPALFVCVVDCLGIDGALNVTFDSLNGLKNEVGGKVRELLDTAVSDSCCVGVFFVSEETYFDDGKMSAKAGVRLVFTPDMLKNPFEFRLIPSVGDAEGDESRGQLIFGHDLNAYSGS